LKVKILPSRYLKVLAGSSPSFTCVTNETDADVTWIRGQQRQFTGSCFNGCPVKTTQPERTFDVRVRIVLFLLNGGLFEDVYSFIVFVTPGKFRRFTSIDAKDRETMSKFVETTVGRPVKDPFSPL